MMFCVNVEMSPGDATTANSAIIATSNTYYVFFFYNNNNNSEFVIVSFLFLFLSRNDFCSRKLFMSLNSYCKVLHFTSVISRLLFVPPHSVKSACLHACK